VFFSRLTSAAEACGGTSVRNQDPLRRADSSRRHGRGDLPRQPVIWRRGPLGPDHLTGWPPSARLRLKNVWRWRAAGAGWIPYRRWWAVSCLVSFPALQPRRPHRRSRGLAEKDIRGADFFFLPERTAKDVVFIRKLN